MFTLVTAIALSAALLVEWAAVRVGIPVPSVQSQADGCLADLRTANTAFKAAAAADTGSGRDPNRHLLSLSDPGVVSTLRCQNALVALVGAPKDAGDDAAAIPKVPDGNPPTAADGDDNVVVDNSQLAGAANQTSNCSFASPGFKDGTAGLDYSQSFTAANPLGPEAFGTASMSNPSSGACGGGGGPALDNGGNVWKGSCFVGASNSKGLTGQATVTLTASKAFAPPLDPVTGDCPQGLTRATCQNGTCTPSTNGDRCVLIPTASANNNCTLSAAVDGSIKSAISFDATHGYCVLSCSGVASFTWVPKPPTAFLTISPTQIELGQFATVTLKYVIQNGASASIDQGVGAITLDASGNASSVGAKLSPLPTQTGTFTYTLTVQGAPGTPPAVATATLTVKNPAFAITLTAGSGVDNTAVTDSSVTVGGKVTPIPQPGASVTIGVNGVPTVTVPVDGSGAYFATVNLPRTTPPGAIEVINDDAFLGQCGDAASPVFIGNNATFDQVTNFLEAAVLHPGGENDSNTATLTVTHAVKLTSDISLTWSGKCAGPAGSLGGAGHILRFGDFVVVQPGVTCGVDCPGHGTQCTAFATVKVFTTVGTVAATAEWDINIP